MKLKKVNKLGIMLIFIVAAMLFVPAIAFAEGDPEKVELGTAEDYAVLAGSEITNTGPTTITGDIGLDPGTSVSGYTDITHDGELNVDNAAALQAKDDLQTAYTDAAIRPGATEIATELGGQNLTPGVYDSASETFEITGTLNLYASNPNDAFIFQMPSTLITASGSSVVLSGQATFCQVFWQVGSSATLGTNSTFVGHILAQESITAESGAKVEGQLLALTGAVTLNDNTITNVPCEGNTTTGIGSDYAYPGFTLLETEFVSAALTNDDSQVLTDNDTQVLSGTVELPATGGFPIAEALSVMGVVLMAIGGVILKKKLV